MGSEPLEARLALDVAAFSGVGVATDWTVLLASGSDSIYMQRVATGADLVPDGPDLLFANNSSFLDQGPGTFGVIDDIDARDTIYVTTGEANLLFDVHHDAYPLPSGTAPPLANFQVTTQFVLSRASVDQTDEIFGSISYNGRVWTFKNDAIKNSVPGDGSPWPAGNVTLTGPTGATIVEPIAISFADSTDGSGDALVSVTWDSMPVVTPLVASPLLTITYDANELPRGLTPPTKDAPGFFDYNQDYVTDIGRAPTPGGLARFTVPVLGGYPGGIIPGTLRGTIDVDADGVSDYTFAPVEMFSGDDGVDETTILAFNEIGDTDPPTRLVTFLTGDANDPNLRTMDGFYDPGTGTIFFEFRNPATGGIQPLNGRVRLPVVEYATYAEGAVPISATFSPGLDIANEVVVDLLASGSSINVQSPILQARGGTVDGADIVLRATNVNINALTQALDVLRVGPSIAAREPLLPSPATAYAVVDASGRIGAIGIPPGFGGRGYLSPPLVTIGSPAAGGVQATAEAVVENGTVIGFTITNPGSGYTSIPNVTIAAPPPPPPPEALIPAIAEQFIVDAGVAARYYDIRLGDDPDTSSVTRGRLAISPSGSLSGAIAATPAAVTTPAQAVFVQADNTDVLIEGMVFANEQTYLLQSAKVADPDPGDGLEPQHQPFVMSTRSLAAGTHTGQIRGNVLAVTLGNDTPTAFDGATATNVVDLETKVDSVRITAATRKGAPLSGPFPYLLTLRDADAVAFDAVAASGSPIRLSADGDIRFNASLATASDLFISARGSFTVSAPVSTTKGRIGIEGTSIAVNNSLRVLDSLADSTTDDISLLATAGDIFLTGAVGAVNNIDLVQVNKDGASVGKIYGPQRLVADRLTITAAGSVDINTNVSSLSGVAKTGFAVREADDIAITSLRSGGLVSLRADGVDPRFDGPFSVNSVALSAVLTDVANLEASAPNGSVEIVNDTAKTTVIGNAAALAAGTAPAMTAAGSVSIRSTSGSIDVLDAPLAGGGGLPVRVATTETLPAATYAQNVPGTRASTLTANVNGSLNAAGIDGVTSLRLNDRVLVRNQAPAAQNGVYVVTSVGGPAERWVLTRAAEADTTGEFSENRAVRVLDGQTQAGKVFTIGYTDTLGITPISLDVVPNRASSRRARAATTVSLPGIVNAAGTITSLVNQALPAVDGVSLMTGDRVLVRAGTHTMVSPDGLPSNVIRSSNGLYEVTNVGSSTIPWVLTRTGDADETAEIPGYVNVAEGTLATPLSGFVYRLSYDSLGVSPLTVSQAVLGTDIGSNASNSVTRFVVSSSAGTNAAAGSLGKLVSLRQANETAASPLNPDQRMEFRFSSLVSQRINLTQQLPAITAAFAIDGAARYTPSGVPAITAPRLVVDGSRIAQTRTGLALFNGTLAVRRLTANTVGVATTSPLLSEIRPGMVITGAAIRPGATIVSVNPTTGVLTLTADAVSGTGLTTVSISPELNGFDFVDGSSGSTLANVAVGGFANGAAVKIAGGVDGIAVRDSLIGQDAAGGRLGNRYGVLVSGNVSSATIAGNTIVANTAAGVRVQEAATNVILVGNTVGSAVLPNTTGIEFESTGSNRAGADPILPSGVITVGGVRRAGNTIVLPASFAGIGTLTVGLGVRGPGIAENARIVAVNAGTRTLTLTSGGVTSSGIGTVTFGNYVATTNFGRSIVLPAGVVMDNLFIGQVVNGTGIAAGSRITAIDRVSRSITLSLAMTATGTTAVTFAAPSRNMIQFNRLGMLLAQGMNTVTNSDVFSSTFDGIRITGGQQTIGTSIVRSATSNAVYSNGGFGINIVVTPTNPVTNHVIRGNFLGTRSPGTVRLPNVLGDLNPLTAVNQDNVDASGNLQGSRPPASGGAAGRPRPRSSVFPLR